MLIRRASVYVLEAVDMFRVSWKMRRTAIPSPLFRMSGESRSKDETPEAIALHLRSVQLELEISFRPFNIPYHHSLISSHHPP
jgi:hypothetical protein